MWLKRFFGRQRDQEVRSASNTQPARRRPTARQLQLEPLEQRRLLAVYGWDGAGNLQIDLGTGEDLTVSEAGGTRSFALSAGTFTASGMVAPAGDGTAAIDFFGGDDISNSIGVDNPGVGAGSNDVTFAGGSLISTTITIDANQAGATSAIDFSNTVATTTSFTATTVNLTANGAPITDSTGNVNASSVFGQLSLSAVGQAITLDNPANDFRAVTFDSVSATASSLTISDADNIAFGAVNVTGNVNIGTAGAVFFNDLATVGGSLDVDTNANGGTGGLIDGVAGGGSDNPSLSITGTTTLDSGVQAALLTAPTNDFQGAVTIAASSTASLVDTNALTLAAVTSTGDVRVETGTTLAINGAVGLGAGDLTLDAGGAVTQSAAITAAGLELLGTGPYSLSDPGNDVDTIAANTTEAVTYRDTDDLDVGTVNTAGITTTNDTVAITASGALLSQLIDVGTSNVFLFVDDAGLMDGNGAANNVVATNAILRIDDGVGTGADPIEITVTNLDVSNTSTGGIFITDLAGGLNVTDLGGISSRAVDGIGGGGAIVASSPLTISGDAITTGGMTYTATDSATDNVDHLTVTGAGTDVRDDTALTLNAGDDLILSVGTVVEVTGGASTLNLNIDAGDADAGGETANLFGIIGTGGQNIVLSGGNDGDTYNIDDNGGGLNDNGTVNNIQDNLVINSGGGLDNLNFDDSGDPTGDPAIAVSSTGPGSGAVVGLSPSSFTFNSFGFGTQVTLALSNDSVTGDQITVTPNANIAYNLNGNLPSVPTSPDVLLYNGNGTKTILAPSVGQITSPGVGPVTFVDFEAVGATGANLLDDVLDLTLPSLVSMGSQDGLPNEILLRVDPSGMYLDIMFDGDTTGGPGAALISRQVLADVGSLRIRGGSDDDLLRIEDVGGGLPTFLNNPVASHTNSAYNAVIGGTVGLHFDGGGSVNSIQLDLGGANVAYFSDAVGAPNSGVIDLNAGAVGGTGAFSLSFEDVAPLAMFVAGPGSLLVDASAAPTDLAIDDDAFYPPGIAAVMPLVMPPAPGNGISVIYDWDWPLTPGFETVQFAGFGDVTVRGGGGGQFIDLMGLDPVAAPFDIILDGDSSIAPDLSDDTLQVETLPAGTTATLMGGPDTGGLGDTYNLISPIGSLDGILGPVVVQPLGSPSPAFPAPEEGGVESLFMLDPFDPTGDTIVITDTTVDGITGPDVALGPDVYYGYDPFLVAMADLIEGVYYMTSSTMADTLHVESTRTGSFNWVETGGGSDTINVFSNASTAAFPGDGSSVLNNINGQLSLATGTGTDILNVSDFGDSVGDTYSLTQVGAATEITFGDGAAPVDIVYDVLGAGELEFFNLVGSRANLAPAFNVYNINDTTATTATVISDGQAGLSNDSTFHIDASMLVGTNSFMGNDDDDIFNVNLTGAGAITAPLNIEGQANNFGGGIGGRDEVVVTDAFGLGAVAATFTYTGLGVLGGEVTATGLGSLLTVDTAETVRYQGVGGDDQITVVGTPGDDLLTAAPIGPNQAIVFNGGNPFDGPPEVFANSLPGVAGGSVLPDLDLISIDNALGLTILDGGGTADRLYVYGESEVGLSDGRTFDPFSFGAGVILPVVGAPGAAFDTIIVNDTSTQVDAHALVNYNNTDFQQASPLIDPAVVINAGEEPTNPVGPVPAVADDIILSLSPTYKFQVNGSDPDPATTGIVPPDGDRLQVPGVFPVVNVYSNKATPPAVTIEYPGSGLLPYSYSSIENLPIINAATVNLIGDNNDPLVDQTDNFVVVGQDVDSNPADGGVGEFSLVINGSQPIFFNGVQNLNVFGDDLAGTPSAGNDVDTLEITPYADDTPRGWGIDVFFDEGNPSNADGVQADLIILHTALFGGQVSEDIVIKPSGLEDGEIIVTNASFGTPIVDIDYVNNLDIIVHDDDGFLNDTDTLTLLGTDPSNPGTSGMERVDANFAAAGTLADPMVVIRDDGVPAPNLLYRLRNFTGFDSINIATLGGDDTIAVVGRADGSLTVNVDGGLPDGSDTLQFDATTGNDNYRITPGSDNRSGVASVSLAGAPVTAVNYTGTERIDIRSIGLHTLTGDLGDDTLRAEGTTADDTFTLLLNGDDNGHVHVNDGPRIVFDDIANITGTNIITLDAWDGVDTFNLMQAPGGTDFNTVNVYGAIISTGDTAHLLGVNADDSALYTPTGASTGTIDLTTAGLTTQFHLVGIDVATYDAVDVPADNDTLTIPTTDATITPGAQPGSGVITPVDATGAALLPLTYSNVENAITAGTTAVIQGTAEDDTISVSATGILTVTNTLGFSNSVDVSGFTDLVLNSLGGDDTIIFDGAAVFTSVTIIGGENGTASDFLVLQGDNTAVETVNIAPNATNATDQDITGLASPFTVSGVEKISFQGGNLADTLVVVNGGGDNTVRVDSGNGSGDRIISDSLPKLYLEDFATLQIDQFAGLDEVTFDIGNLGGAAAYEVFSSGGDAVVIEGNDGSVPETITVDRPAGTDFEVNGLVRGITGIAPPLLRINSLGGDDTLIVDTSSGLIGAPIHFDGAVGNDGLVVQGTTAVTTVAYSSGPDTTSGSLDYDSGAMTITFTGLEPILDTLVAVNLIVNGTNADNAISYTQGVNPANGLVSVDGFETIEFANKTNLWINGLAGDDTVNLNNPTTPAGPLTGITVDGGDPTASDAVIVNATTGVDAIAITAITNDGATVTGAQPVPVTVLTTESLIIDGAGGGDSLTYTSPAGTQEITFTPGAATDAGAIAAHANSAVALLSVAYEDLGTGGTLTFADAGGLRDDAVDVRGTDDNDLFRVDGAGLVRLYKPDFVIPASLPIATPGTTVLRLLGREGSDIFDVAGDFPFPNGVDVQGGDPGSGSDVLNFNGSAAGAVTLNLQAQTVTETGFASVRYTGIETVNADANSQVLTVLGTAVGDTIEVTPFGGSAGTLQANGQAPIVNYTNVNANTINVNPSGGQDVLVVNATLGMDTVAVNVPGSLVDTGASSGFVAFTLANTEALIVNGREGDDTFTVTQGSLPNSIPVSIDGGDPVGVVGDTLNLVPPSTPTFVPGPEGDEGGFFMPGAESVTFDGIEAAAVDLSATGAAIVTGTGANDHITVVGIATGTVDVQVNNGPIVRYSNATNLSVQAGNGDDVIDVDVNLAALGVTLNLDGGLPTAGSDTLRVTGVGGDAADTVIWDPSGSDSGTLTVVGQTINVSTIEHLIYDGESDGDTVRVDGGGRFVHTPGATIDAGRLDLESAGVTQLGLAYENLGAGATVVANGTGGDDSLVVLGTDGSDLVNVAFSAPNAIAVDVTSAFGLHVAVTSTDIENYEIRTLDGDDDVNIADLVDASGTFAVLGGGPSAGSDTLHVTGTPGVDVVTIAPDGTNSDDQDIMGLGTTIDVTGIELITYDGGASDTLTVDPGWGDHQVRVDNAAPAAMDRVTSDSLPKIEFENLATFVVAPSSTSGNDAVTFVTRNLVGSVAYQAILDGNDTLVIEGSDGADDDYTVRSPAFGTLQVSDAFGATVTSNIMTGRLQINTLGGNDLVTVDDTNLVNPAPDTPPLITYDGGGGSDTLLVMGTTPVQQVEYMPGPSITEGRLAYSLVWGPPPSRDMIIDFVNLEPVIDLVPKTVAMTVYGTNADNAINYIEGPNSGVTNVLNPAGFVTGLISIDGYETIEFANFTGGDDVLEIIGLAGDDVINLNNPTTPSGPLERIWVEGSDPTASDHVIINGTTVDDTIDISPTGMDSADITVNGFLTQVFTAELITINGQGGNDNLTLTTPAGGQVVILDDGPLADGASVTMREFGGAAYVPFDFVNLGYDGSFTVADAGAGRVDELVINASDPANVDAIFTVAPSGTVSLESPSLPTSAQELVDVLTPSVALLRLHSFDGDDLFNIAANHPFAEGILIEGGGPSASDVVNFLGTGADPVRIGLTNVRLREGAFGLVEVAGVEVVNVDAGGAAVDVQGTRFDDDLTYTPDTTDAFGAPTDTAGQIVKADLNTVFNVRFASLLTVNAREGDDTLTVNASAAGETIDVNGTLVDVNGLLPVNYTGLEALAVNGLEGDDLFNVSPAAFPIFIDGGDPIGTSAGDLLNYSYVGAFAFEPGPESDEGGFVNGVDERVSFDHVEALMAMPGPGPVLISGTNGDDDITIIARDDSTHPILAGFTPGVRDMTVSVNAGPDLLLINVATLYVDALAGDDDIVVRAPAPNQVDWDVDITVAGGPPAASDRLVFETVGTQSVDYTPTGIDTGEVVLNQAVDNSTISMVSSFTIVPINYISSPGGIEHFIYDGQGGDDTLTVHGDGVDVGTDDDFVHTPGTLADSGRVHVALAGANSLLGVSYENLGHGGLLYLDGEEGNNQLVALGTMDSDLMAIGFPASNAAEIDLHSAAGDHVRIETQAIATYELRTLEGDDEVHVDAPLQLAGDPAGSLAIFGGGPSGSDALFLNGAAATVEDVRIAPDATNPLDQDVTGLGAPIDVSGIELITYTGVDDDDILTVDPGMGDHAVRVDNGPTDNDTDRVRSESLPEIHFTALDTFVVRPNSAASGVNVVTFVTGALRGAANYHTDLGTFDALAIEGREGDDDDYTVTHPAGSNVVITDNNSSVAVTDLLMGGAVGGLRLNTLGGDDLATVDVSSLDLINVPIEYNGGGGSDLLTVTGTPATPVDEVIYMPGPAIEEGRLLYEDAANEPLMLIDFTDLEPVVDLVPAAMLTVLGTNADNAISYTQSPNVATWGMVTVDAYESIEFANKDELVLNALAGDDVISLNNQSTPDGPLTLITVDGGDPTASDRLVYTGSDAITVTQGAVPYDGTITNAPLPPVNFTNTEHVAVTATGAGDVLTIEGTDIDERITVDVGNAFGEGAAQVDGGFNTTFTGAEQVDVVANDLRSDNLTINGRDAADQFTLTTGGLGTAVWAQTNESVPQDLLYITFGDDVEHLLLETLGGDDIIDVDATGIAASDLLTVTVSGDGPSGSDTLNFMRDPSSGDEVVVELDATPFGNVVQEISQSGIPAPVRLLGIETARIDVDSGDLYVAGTRADDVITYTPLSEDSGKFTAEYVATTFFFDGLPEGSSEFVITGGGTGWGGPTDGGFADKVIVVGTAGSDLLTANVVTRNIGLEVLGFGFPPPVVAAWRSVTLDDGTTAFGTPGIIEAVTVNGTDGNDTFHVVMRDNGTPAPPVGNGLYVDVLGGSPMASDALVITALDAGGDPVALPATDMVVVGKSRIADAGNVLVYQSAIRRPHISYENVEVVSPNVAGGDNLLILGPDMYEENEYMQTASILGTADVISLQNLAIFPNVDEHPGVPADLDWFAVKAEKTGTLDIAISFRTFDPDLLPAGGQLGIQVVDATGTVIAGDGALVGGLVPDGFGAYDADPNARVRFPAVAGQTYYFRVFGQSNVDPFGADDQVVNGYDMTVINEAAPVPYDIELADIIGASTVSAGAVLDNFSVAASDTLSEVDDFYNGKYIYFLSGNLAGRRAEVADYVAITRTFTLVAGGVSAAPTAGSEILVETHDTGRSQLDDTTRDDTPVIRFRLDDADLLYDLPGNTVPDTPIDEAIRIPFDPAQTRDTSTPGYRVAVFIEGELQQPDTEPQVPIGYARAIDIDGDGIPDGIYEFDFETDAINLAAPNGATTAFPLTDGSHFISAKVQIVDPDDPDDNPVTLDNLTAFGVRSVSHEIVVDTVIPPVWFGDPIVAADGLHPDSDTGIEDQPDTFVDRITSDTTPSFWGLAEADTIVYVYADLNDNDILELNVDLLLGKTVAVPNDGTNQFPNGQWNMTTNIDMNDPAYFPVIDGTRTIFAITEDLAGNIDDPADAQVLDIFVDTRGPQVDAVEITTAPAYDLFDPKPSTDGPTPLVFSLDIDFIDRPNRDAPFVYPAVNEILATTAGNIILVGDFNGVIPIESIDFVDSTVDGGLGTTTVRLNFFAPLPDDRYTLTVSDRITDRAFNALDGESHVQEPQEVPTFPSGDGVPGEDFFARFTVDSRPEVATYAAGSVWADTNGNGFFDPNNLDYTNRDIIYNFGFTSDDLFVGNFAGPDATADGFDKLAAYGRVPGGGFRWQVDTDNDGVPNDLDGDGDLSTTDPLQLNGLPVAGNFDGSGGNGDEVGLYTAETTGGSVWYFDTNHDFMLDGASELVSELHGVPFVGDFNGDGLDDLGTWEDDTFEIDLAPWNGTIDVTFRYGFIGVRERPVVADMDQDGYDDLGLWVPDRSGVAPGEGAEWYFLISNNLPGGVLSRIEPDVDLGVDTINFEPVPFGPDLFMQFGDDYAMPLLGNFDPPVVASGATEPGVFQIDGTAGDDDFRFSAGDDGQTWTVTLNGVEQTIPTGTESVLFNGLGGLDTAYLRGSDGDDVFASSPAGSTLSGTGFAVTTQGVETVHAYGLDGNDSATLNDTAGNDSFKANLEADYAKMYGGGFFTRAKFFENVTGVFSDGNDDYARVWDTSGNDQMTASSTGLTLAGDVFHVNVQAFDRLLAYSTRGGVDTVNLYDSPGDDTMRARSHKTQFWGPGFDITLRGWEDVVAHSDNGGYDQAKLHDTLGNDVVLTGDDWASLSTLADGELDLLYAAYGFDAVKGYHSEGQDKSPDPTTVDFLMLDDEGDWDLQ